MNLWYILVAHCKTGLFSESYLIPAALCWGFCSLFDYRPLSPDSFPTPPFLSYVDPWIIKWSGTTPKKEVERNEIAWWKPPVNVMHIYYELHQNHKFTTLWQAYKIAIFLTVYAILMYSKAWVLSISVSQIIQTFKCEVNIKCCLLNNMQPWHMLFLFSTPSVVQEHIIAAFTQVIWSLHRAWTCFRLLYILQLFL